MAPYRQQQWRWPGTNTQPLTLVSMITVNSTARRRVMMVFLWLGQAPMAGGYCFERRTGVKSVAEKNFIFARRIAPTLPLNPSAAFTVERA